MAQCRIVKCAGQNCFEVILQKFSGSRMERHLQRQTVPALPGGGYISITSTDPLWDWFLSTLELFYPMVSPDRRWKAFRLPSISSSHWESYSMETMFWY